MAGRYSSIGDSDQVGLGDARRSALLELEGGQSFRIEGTTNIGRSPNSQIVLTARSVSREHARILFEDDKFILKDLGSSNGTFLNGKRIKSEELNDRDRIDFGDLKAVFRSSGALRPSDSTDPSSRYRPIGGTVGDPVGQSRSRRYPIRADGGRSALSSREKAVARNHTGAEGNKSRPQRALSPRPPGGQAGDPGVSQRSGAVSQRNRSVSPEQENERLRKLVKQLERALADNNIRLRNLQEELDRLRG